MLYENKLVKKHQSFAMFVYHRPRAQETGFWEILQKN